MSTFIYPYVEKMIADYCLEKRQLALQTIMEPIGPLDIPKDSVKIGYICYGIGCNGPCCDPYGNQFFQEIYSEDILRNRTTLYKQQGEYGKKIPLIVLEKYDPKDGHDENGHWDSRLIGELF